ncbi:hypothetical protein [Nonomuraea angiospora]|nr:hypothetical protein [Nonomuraea angiospora]MDX3103503.1 hypothetical protein [Nonomuraea angiospora]
MAERTGMNVVNADGTAVNAGSRYTHVYATDSSGIWRLASARGAAIRP